MKHVVYNIEHNENEILEIALEVLEKRGLVVAPSDTVYGLLVDATNEAAVQKLVTFKNRPPGKPISVFVSDFAMLQRHVMIKKKQSNLLKELLPGPFTIVLPSFHRVSKNLESERGTLGVRIPNYHFIIDLVRRFGSPITATSANLSGKSIHYSIHSFSNKLPQSKKSLIDLIIDVGTLPKNKPSTIIDLTKQTIKIIRHGDIVFRDEKTYVSKSPSQTKKLSQYILKKFASYAEKKPLIFILQGDLGVGKTVFIKGLGEYLGISNIVSPTFVVSYEYEINRKGVKKLVHFDLYNIQEEDEFRYLGIEEYLKKGNTLCFEWGEKAAKLLSLLKKRGKIVYVKMKYIDERQREIQVKY